MVSIRTASATRRSPMCSRAPTTVRPEKLAVDRRPSARDGWPKALLSHGDSIRPGLGPDQSAHRPGPRRDARRPLDGGGECLSDRARAGAGKLDGDAGPGVSTSATRPERGGTPHGGQSRGPGTAGAKAGEARMAATTRVCRIPSDAAESNFTWNPADRIGAPSPDPLDRRRLLPRLAQPVTQPPDGNHRVDFRSGSTRIDGSVHPRVYGRIRLARDSGTLRHR